MGLMGKPIYLCDVSMFPLLKMLNYHAMYITKAVMITEEWTPSTFVIPLFSQHNCRVSAVMPRLPLSATQQ